MSRAASASKPGPVAATPRSSNKPRINVIYYSMYGHIATSKFNLLIYLKITFKFSFVFLLSGEISSKRR